MIRKFLRKAGVIALGFTLIILHLYVIKQLLEKILTVIPWAGPQLTSFGTFFIACIFAPLWEELVFRHAPLQIGKRLKKRFKLDLIWPIVIISSFLFGWGHGYGQISILIQGVGGLVMSAVYLRNRYSYWSSVIVHAMWNFSLFYIFPEFCSKYGITLW